MAVVTFDALLRGLKQGGTPAAVYYLHGDEDVLKDEAVRALVDRMLDPGARDFNFDQRSAADLDPEAFHSLVNTPPLLAAARVVVLRGIEDVRKTSKVRQELLRYLESPSPTTLLILVQGAGQPPDAELARSASAVAVEPLPHARVLKWVAHRAGQLKLAFEPDAVELLVQSVGRDLGALGGELEKLAALTAGRRAGHAGVRGGTLGHCARRCGSPSMPTARSSRPRSPTSRGFSYSWCCRSARSSRRQREARTAGRSDRRTDTGPRRRASVRQSDRPTVRPDRLRPRARPPHRPDPSGLRPRHHAPAARAPLAPGFALPGSAVHRRAHRDGRRCRCHQSPTRGRRVRALGLGRFGARAAHAALFRAGGPGGDGAGSGAAAARLPRYAAQAARGLLGCPGLLRSEGRRARVRLDPRGTRLGWERRRV